MIDDGDDGVDDDFSDYGAFDNGDADDVMT